MEVDKADQLYRQFQQTDAGARFKRGLGFDNGSNTSASDWPGDKNKPTSGLSSTFVKAGDAPKQSSQRDTQSRSDYQPGQGKQAAARVAARLEELKAAKQPKQQYESEKHTVARQQKHDLDDKSTQAGSRSQHESRDRKRERSRSQSQSSERDRHTSRNKSRDREEMDLIRERDSDKRRRRNDSRDRDDGRDSDRRRRTDDSRERKDDGDTHRSRRRDNSREGSTGRDSNRKRGRDDSRERYSGRDRHGSRQRDDSRERDADRDDRSRHSRDDDRDRHYDRDRRQDRSRSRERGSRSRSGYGRHRSTEHSSRYQHDTSSRDRGHRNRTETDSHKNVVDWERVIPGYDRMSAAEQLRARTAYELKQAESQDVKRSRQEAREQREAEREGEDTGVQRQWTRFVFNQRAALEEETAEELQQDPHHHHIAGLAGDDQHGNVREVAKKLGVEGDGEHLNTVTFKSSSQAAATKQRDHDHAAAIFGAPAAQTAAHLQKKQQAGTSTEDEANHGGTAADKTQHASAHNLGQEALRDVLEGKRDWSSIVDEDGPTLVLDDECQKQAEETANGATAGMALPQDNKHDMDRSLSNGQQVSDVLSEAVVGQQQLSWRQRAQQTREQKEKALEQHVSEIAAPAATTMTLPLSWRDKAKMRKGIQPATLADADT